MELEHLFDAHLHFQAGMGPLVSIEDREGELVGSGNGAVAGPAVRGMIYWSNFETQGERLCGMYPAGRIETDDGATIRFDARGWALRPDRNAPVWHVAGGLRLETDDEHYAWLERSLAVWEGRFDTSTGRATWRIYGNAQDPPSGASCCAA